jgi:hypothetical protein
VDVPSVVGVRYGSGRVRRVVRSGRRGGGPWRCASAGILRVYTIGFGITTPAPSVCTADQISGGAAIGGDRPGQAGGFGGGRRNQQIDEKTLTQVAEITGGRYFKAEDSAALTDVLLDLPSSISLQRKDMEVTVWFALAGAVLVLVASGRQRSRLTAYLNAFVAVLTSAGSQCALQAVREQTGEAGRVAQLTAFGEHGSTVDELGRCR